MMTNPLSKDEIYHLTAELEQHFMQDDFDSAEYAIRKFFKPMKEENEALKKKVRRMQKDLDTHAFHARRQFLYSQDYLEYDDDDRR